MLGLEKDLSHCSSYRLTTSPRQRLVCSSFDYILASIVGHTACLSFYCIRDGLFLTSRRVIPTSLCNADWTTTPPYTDWFLFSRRCKVLGKPGLSTDEELAAQWRRCALLGSLDSWARNSCGILWCVCMLLTMFFLVRRHRVIVAKAILFPLSFFICGNNSSWPFRHSRGGLV